MLDPFKVKFSDLVLGMWSHPLSRELRESHRALEKSGASVRQGVEEICTKPEVCEEICKEGESTVSVTHRNRWKAGMKGQE